MSVLVTGGAGYVGSIVAEALSSQAAGCLYKPFEIGDVVEMVSQYREPGSAYARQGEHTTR